MPPLMSQPQERKIELQVWARYNDKELMEFIAQGHKLAFTEFVTRHSNKIVNFALLHVNRLADAEDITQETFIRVWQKSAGWKDIQIPPQHWLYRIARNLCIDCIRKRKPQLSLDEKYEPIETDTPENTLQLNGKMNTISIALQSLPERQRTAITLCAYHSLSNRDTANLLQISVEALESLLARGRRNLRKFLIEREEQPR